MSTEPETPPTDERAVTRDDGGGVNLDGFDWPSLGEYPPSASDALYEPKKEPKARFDNKVETVHRENSKRLNHKLGELEDRLDNLENDVSNLREEHNSLEDAFRKHNHDKRYYRKYETYTKDEADNRFAPWPHNHDERYYRKQLADDRFLSSIHDDSGDGRISLPELELRVGEGFEVIGDGNYWGKNNDARLFRAKDDNSDGGFVWEFTDQNGENRQEMLAIRAPGRNNSITHGGATVWHADNDGHRSGLDADKLDGAHKAKFYRDLYDVSGDKLKGHMDVNRNQLKNTARVTSPHNSQRLNFFDDGMSLGAPYGSGDVKVLDQTYFTGGSVYVGNSQGKRNDSYDLSFQNEPSGKDFRMHLKEDPNNSALTDTHGMFFSISDYGPHMTVNVDKQRTHVKEIRSVRQERSGTPLANGYLGNASDIGEIWYDPGPGEFRGKRGGGQVVRLGEPVNS